MSLTANVLYVSNKLDDYIFNLNKCFVVEHFYCYNLDSLVLVLTKGKIECPSELVYTKNTFDTTQLELLESADFSVEIVDLFRKKIQHIINRYNENFADYTST